MQITVAIPTFDRRDVLAVSAEVLSRVSWLDHVNLRVYDDASSLSLDELRSFYPTATETIKRPKNLGADDHCRQIFIDFLATQDDCLLVLDSDLVVSDKALQVLLEAMPHTDGVLSLYNSCRHQSQQAIRCGEHHCELKQTIGAAGMALSRNRVEEIVRHVPPGRSFDFRVSQYLIRHGYRICVTSNSYVQHIGFDGYNCKDRVVDFGLSFDCHDERTKAAMYPFMEIAMLSTHQYLQRFDQEYGIHLRYTTRILERSIRHPLKRWLGK